MSEHARGARGEQAAAALQSALELARRGLRHAKEGSLGVRRPSAAEAQASPIVDRAVSWGFGGAIILLLCLAPVILPDFELKVLGIKTMWLGIAAASLIFLAGYGGMISLAQTAMYGIAGFSMANLGVAEGGSSTAWNPWLAALAGVAIATGLGLVFGAIAARSEGIYFLMLTLAIGVITYYFFGQVEELSGFGGVNVVEAPGPVGSSFTRPDRLYYTALICAAAVYLVLRYIVRTPFGLTLQGIRDDPLRMRSLGYNVALHRTLAFGFGALVASVGGILSVWDNAQISPGSVDLIRTINVLAIAVVGGLHRIEGAWVGAFAFTLVTYLLQRFVTVERVDTYFGLVFLVIILVSPGGLMGLWGIFEERVKRTLRAWPRAAERPAA